MRESEEPFRGTFENAAVGIRHQDLDGRFLRVNQKFCSIVGYPRDELLQKTAGLVHHPDDLPARVELPEAVLRGESAGFTLEKRYVRRDGSVVFGGAIRLAPAGRGGQPNYVIGIVQDISKAQAAGCGAAAGQGSGGGGQSSQG